MTVKCISVLLDKLLSLQQESSSTTKKVLDVVVEEGQNKQEEEEIEAEEISILSPNTPTPTITAISPIMEQQRPPPIVADEPTNQHFISCSSSRPKKRTRRGDPVESKLRRVQPLEKEENGKYKLPARVGIITVHSLGKVVPIPTYHNYRYIWPPGFKISRFVSLKLFIFNDLFHLAKEGENYLFIY